MCGFTRYHAIKIRMNYYLMTQKMPSQNILWFDGVNRLCYDDILREAEKLAECFKQEEKEVIGIKEKCPLFQLLAFLACNKANQVPVILHPNLSEEETDLILRENKINYLLTVKGLIKKYNYKVNIKAQVCMAALTSGSDGIPKLLYRTYESWGAFFEVQNEVFRIGGHSKLFFHGSLSFTGNLNAVLSALRKGAQLVTEENFEPKMWASRIQQCSVDVVYLVPVKLKILCKVLGGQSEGVRCIFTGSQQVTMGLADELVKRFPNAEIIVYYGAGELNYVTCVSIKELKHKPMSLGKPFKGVEVSIRDGEIYVSSEYLADGIKCPATVHDTGYIDKEGDLIFQGRGSGYINKGGVKISTLCLENKISALKEVEGVSVVAFEDEKKGNEIALFVKLNKRDRRMEFRRSLKNVLNHYEMPKKICIVEEFILNDSGKVDKEEMLRRFA